MHLHGQKALSHNEELSSEDPRRDCAAADPVAALIRSDLRSRHSPRGPDSCNSRLRAARAIGLGPLGDWSLMLLGGLDLQEPSGRSELVGSKH